MEQKIKINVEDGYRICGTLNYNKVIKKKLIIFVHGLTGHQNEHQFYNAVKFFNRKGYSTFRFDLYSMDNNSRSLTNSTMAKHISDLNLVISHFKNRYEQIFLVGHSLGGMIILQSNISPIVSLVLWDPSLKKGLMELVNKDCHFNEKIRKYIVSWGVEYLLDEKMINEWKNINDDSVIENISKPVKIICAEKGSVKRLWQKYFLKIKAEKEFFIIKNAGHCFDEEGSEEKLFKGTLDWFKKDI